MAAVSTPFCLRQQVMKTHTTQGPSNDLAIQTHKASLSHSTVLKRENWTSFESPLNGSLLNLRAWPSTTKIGTYILQGILKADGWLFVMANKTTLATMKSSFVSKSTFRTLNSSKNCDLLHTPCKLWRLFYFHLEKSDPKTHKPHNTLEIRLGISSV